MVAGITQRFGPVLREFITKMRELTAKHGTVMIVDEVMTGFRVALHGAQPSGDEIKIAVYFSPDIDSINFSNP